MFSKLSGTGAIALMMGSLFQVEGQNQNRPDRFELMEKDLLVDELEVDFAGLGNNEMKEKKFISSLSCNACIRAGYTYMYEDLGTNKKGEEIASSEVFKDLNEFENYTGVCCSTQKNGKLYCAKYIEKTDSFDVVESENRPLSTRFVDKDVAIAACPTKRTVCGKKRHFLYDSESKPVKFTVNFQPAMNKEEEKSYAGLRLMFQNKKDECHWLIQTKCGIPLISVDAKIPEIMDYIDEKKLRIFEQYEDYELYMEQVKFLDRDFRGEKRPTVDSKIKLSYIEYNPAVTQEFTPFTVLYNGDYPGDTATPFKVNGNFARDPSDYADIRQYVRKAGVSPDEELSGDEKYRWFPATLISDSLLSYQKYLKDWEMKREENDISIMEYNKLIGQYKLRLSKYEKARDAYYEEDRARMELEGEGATPRGRLEEGIIRPLSDTQITPAYNEFVAAYDEAVKFFDENIKSIAESKVKPEQIEEYKQYDGYKFSDFQPVYGYGLPTSGTYSLDHYNYGAYKSFGVLGQQGVNKKTYYKMVEDYFEAMDALNKLYGDENDKQTLKDVKNMVESFFSPPKDQGQLLEEGCRSSFVLLSLTPQTFKDSAWNAKNQDSEITVTVRAMGVNKERPLTPEFIEYPKDQLEVNPMILLGPGETITTEGALLMKAASASMAALAALYLY